MENLENLENLEKFIPENKYYQKNTDSLCVRCLRKKYKCIIIFLLCITVICQLFVLMLEKLDKNTIDYLFSDKSIVDNNITQILLNKIHNLSDFRTLDMHP